MPRKRGIVYIFYNLYPILPNYKMAPVVRFVAVPYGRRWNLVRAL